MINRRGFFSLAAVGVATTLSACSTGDSSDGKSSKGSDTASASGSGFPVEIKHALGTTKIEKAPSKVVVIGWGDADTAVALGVTPVAVPTVTWGANKAGSTDWFDAQLAKIGGATPKHLDVATSTPIDAVAALQPDLILATNSGLTAADYTKLTKLAPTVAYPGQPYGTSWEDSTTLVAKALGKVDEGKKLIADTKKKIEDAVASHPELKGKTAAWVAFAPTALNTVSVYTGVDNRPRALKEYGMGVSKGVENIIKNAKAFFVEQSAEKAEQIDADVIVFDQLKGAEADKLKSNALLGKIPALKRGSYVALTDTTASAALAAPSVLSVPVALERFLPQLAAAAKKA